MIIRNGVTRKVFLLGKYAVKIPQIQNGWKNFLNGLLGNMQEVSLSKIKDNRMAPVFFSISGGFLLVMPRCDAISIIQFEGIVIEDFWEQRNEIIDKHTIYFGDLKIPVENKIDSFGMFKGKIVAIDYGS